MAIALKGSAIGVLTAQVPICGMNKVFWVCPLWCSLPALVYGDRLHVECEYEVQNTAPFTVQTLKQLILTDTWIPDYWDFPGPPAEHLVGVMGRGVEPAGSDHYEEVKHGREMIVTKNYPASLIMARLKVSSTAVADPYGFSPNYLCQIMEVSPGSFLARLNWTIERGLYESVTTL